MAKKTEGVTATLQSPFVDKLVDDPNNVPDVMVLCGYPGKSSRENYTRLYLTTDFSDFFEVPSDEILHFVEVPAQQNPLGAFYIWLYKGVRLIRKGEASSDARSGFFAGDIQNIYGNRQDPGTTYNS